MSRTLHGWGHAHQPTTIEMGLDDAECLNTLIVTLMTKCPEMLPNRATRNAVSWLREQLHKAGRLP